MAGRGVKWVSPGLLLDGTHSDGLHRSINSFRSLLLLAGNKGGCGQSENGDVLHIRFLS